VAVRPPHGSPDTSFTFEAVNLSPSEAVQVQFTDPTGAIVYPANSNNGRYSADAAGRLSFTLIPTQSFPAAPLGTWLFELNALGSNRQSVVGFTLH
jgi:hypothetical protein